MLWFFSTPQLSNTAKPSSDYLTPLLTTLLASYLTPSQFSIDLWNLDPVCLRLYLSHSPPHWLLPQCSHSCSSSRAGLFPPEGLYLCCIFSLASSPLHTYIAHSLTSSPYSSLTFLVTSSRNALLKTVTCLQRCLSPFPAVFLSTVPIIICVSYSLHFFSFSLCQNVNLAGAKIISSGFCLCLYHSLLNGAWFIISHQCLE